MKHVINAVVLSAMVSLASDPVKGETDVPVFRGRKYVAVGSPAAMQLTNNAPFTFEVWVRPEYLRTGDTGLLTKNNARTTTRSIMLALRESGTKMSALHNGNTWREIVLPYAVEVGAWHHLAFSFNGTHMSYILDGVALGTQPCAYANNEAHTWQIGGYTDDADFWGNLAEARLWDHARSEAQVDGNRQRRLTGGEEGLLGYWPLDEGAGLTVADKTAHGSDGTLLTADWLVASDLDLDATAVAHPVTGSTRYTGSNEVVLAGLSVPHDCNLFQITLQDNPSALNPAAWLATSTALDSVFISFARPAADTNLTFHAWFTNSLAAVPLRHDSASIFYTTVAPDPVVHGALEREQAPLQPVMIHGTDLDNGSSGGSANGAAMGIYSWQAVAVEPSDDATPDEPYATLDGSGTYPLKLQLVNEAGNSALSATATEVTITGYGGTNLWTGRGLTDRWHDGGNWSAGLPVAGQDVALRLAGASVTLDEPTPELSSFTMTTGTLIFDGWNCLLQATNVVVGGGTVTAVDAFDDFGPSNRVWIAAINDFTLTTPGKIDVNAKGYRSMMGPAKGVLGGYGCGGGHGGQGGTAYKRGGGAHDSLTAPSAGGSGGFYGSDHAGGAGGGVVRLEAGRRATINGVVSANGANGTAQYGGGAAGGAIHITAATFAGNSAGLLQVNGGNERWGRYGGGGGGGRIAITGGAVDADTAVRFAATPGTSMHDLGDGKVLSDRAIPTYLEPFQSSIPHWGTLYIEDPAFLDTLPQANQLTDVVLHVGNTCEWEISALTLSNNRFRLGPEGFTLRVANDLSIGSTAHLGVMGSVFVGGDLLLSGSGRLSVYAPPTNSLAEGFGALVEVGNDIVIADTAWLQPHSHPTNGAPVLLRMRDLRVTGTLAGINASGRGYAGTQGPGRGGNSTSVGRGGGGGYGGNGSIGSYSAAAGVVYGNPYAPLQAGSGGGRGGDPAPHYAGSGYGGGLVWVEAAREVVLDGQLAAYGCAGKTHSLYAGGGSGGGIFVACRRFSGSNTALLAAPGGKTGGEGSGGGGGGRIAIWYKETPPHIRARLLAGNKTGSIMSTNAPAAYEGTVNIAGGDGGATRSGEPGTVWFIEPPPAGSILLLR